MIAEGTTALLVADDGRKHLVQTKRGMIEVRNLGVVNGDQLCSRSFGDRISLGSINLMILKPSVMDLLELMDRRAQIMMPKDSFQIPMYLDIGCGSTVIEGGVGSGALTLVLLKAVAPSGKVFSYELREDHASVARRNVSNSGLESCWELRIGDICSSPLEEGVDAAIMDIPNPWDALDNVRRAVKRGGYIGCYVPNANQLDSTVRKMRALGLMDVRSFETIHRDMVVHEGGVRPSFEMLGHTGYLAFGRRLL